MALDSRLCHWRLRFLISVLFVQKLRHFKRIISLSNLPAIILKYLIFHRVSIQITWTWDSCFCTKNHCWLNLELWIFGCIWNSFMLLGRLREVFLCFWSGSVQVNIPRWVWHRIVLEIWLHVSIASCEYLSMAHCHLLVLWVPLILKSLGAPWIFTLNRFILSSLTMNFEIRNKFPYMWVLVIDWKPIMHYLTIRLVLD